MNSCQGCGLEKVLTTKRRGEELEPFYILFVMVITRMLYIHQKIRNIQ